MIWIKNNWFKLSVVFLWLATLVVVANFLGHTAWSQAYANRAECLNSIHNRNSFIESEKANCYDIIYKLNN